MGDAPKQQVTMLTRIATRDELDRLGFRGYDLGQSAELKWPTSEVSQALGKSDIAVVSFVAMLATKFVGASFAPISHPVLGGLELAALESHGRVVKIVGPAGTMLDIQALEGTLRPGANVYTPPEDPGTAYVDLVEVPALVVRTPAGGVVIGSTGQEIELVDLVRAIELVPLARLNPPVSEWAAECGDSWLMDQIAAKIAGCNSWSRVVAAGMLVRFSQPASAQQAREWVQSLLAGQADKRLSEPLRWVRSLTDHEIASVEALALAEVETLVAECEAFEDAVARSTAGWEHKWRDLCARRDELEGVLLLLTEVEKSAGLSVALVRLDREGEVLRLAVPAGTDQADEWIQRAARKALGSWWVAFSEAS
jgi:hypothetical protein